MRYYKHYKGHYYRVIGEARHSETLEDLVVYQAMYGEQALWVRPKEMFYETVTLSDGRVVARFAPCTEEDALASQQEEKARKHQQHNQLLEDLYVSFDEKGYTAEDFQGGCALCGEANEFALDLIDERVNQTFPSLSKQEREVLTKQLYNSLYQRFEASEK